MTLDAHDTHCCIDHGCKYGNDDCPVANGVRQQQGFCENCGLETEGYYGRPEKTMEEQEEYLQALWDERRAPPERSPQEKLVIKLAKQYGRAKLQSALAAVNMSGMTVPEVIEILGKLKHIA